MQANNRLNIVDYGNASYDLISVLDSTHHKYVIMGNKRTCNTCMHYEVLVLSFVDSSYISEEIFGFDGRSKSVSVFEYNKKEKELNIVYDSPLLDDNYFGSEKDTIRYRTSLKYKYMKNTFVNSKTTKKQIAP